MVSRSIAKAKMPAQISASYGMNRPESGLVHKEFQPAPAPNRSVSGGMLLLTLQPKQKAGAGGWMRQLPVIWTILRMAGDGRGCRDVGT